MSSNPPPSKRVLLLLSIVALLFTLLVGLLLWSSVQTQSIQGVQQTLNEWRPLLALTRWIGITAVVGYWPLIGQWVAARQGFSFHETKALVDARWRILIGLIVLEAILGQALLAKLVILLQRHIQGNIT